MISFEDIRQYLPKYLSAESEKTLYEELRKFPTNIDSRLYTTSLKDKEIIFQGDGIEGLLFVNLPDPKIDRVPAIIISNTCDLSPEHKRFYNPNLVYSPIFNLEKYRSVLIEEGHDRQKVEDHINSIRRQEPTSVFYLPKGGSLNEESLVFFDRINSCDVDYLQGGEIGKLRLFTLTDYGLYLFVFKLSIHFTRIREGIDRGKGYIK